MVDMMVLFFSVLATVHLPSYSLREVYRQINLSHRITMKMVKEFRHLLYEMEISS